jgi:DNA-binding transcriptional MerR regulator
MGMTVQEFSIRTGLPPTTLRFYDRKNLLPPGGRMDNGYRVYSDDQIAQALMIHSLRRTGVSLQEIRRFMNADKQEQAGLLAGWQRELENRLALMRSASQFLGGLQSAGPVIYLVSWDEPGVVVWFEHTVERRIHPFARCIEQDAATIAEWGFGPVAECFVRVKQARGNRMVGEVGFRLNRGGIERIPAGAVTEMTEPTLFAAMESTAEDSTECFRLLRMLERYGFTPLGRAINRYTPGHLVSYRLMIPIGPSARI